MRSFGVMLAGMLVGLMPPLTDGVYAADMLPEPSGPVLLTVTGDFTVKSIDGTARFDLGMLQALPRAEFETTTIWTDGVMRFTGVPLSALLERLQIASATIRAQAINDYSVDIPLAEITEDIPIVAYYLNGEPMSRREKGPLWIVYPYDQDADYRSETVYSRSIWQLDRIEAVQ